MRGSVVAVHFRLERLQVRRWVLPSKLCNHLGLVDSHKVHVVVKERGQRRDGGGIALDDIQHHAARTHDGLLIEADGGDGAGFAPPGGCKAPADVGAQPRDAIHCHDEGIKHALHHVVNLA